MCNGLLIQGQLGATLWNCDKARLYLNLEQGLLPELWGEGVVLGEIVFKCFAKGKDWKNCFSVTMLNDLTPMWLFWVLWTAETSMRKPHSSNLLNVWLLNRAVCMINTATMILAVISAVSLSNEKLDTGNCHHFTKLLCSTHCALENKQLKRSEPITQTSELMSRHTGCK